MNSQKKLKRGLRELSPLFRNSKTLTGQGVAKMARLPKARFNSSAVSSPVQSDPQFISVFSCDDVGNDSFLLSNYLASRLNGKSQGSLVLSITDREGASAKETKAVRGPVKQVVFDWETFSQVWKNSGGLEKQKRSSFDTITFIDFSPIHVPEPQRVACLLDKCVLLVQPTFESLRECFRTIKTLQTFNPTLEYFLIYDGPQADSRGVLIYERLSEMTSKRLGCDLNWMGCLEKMKHDQESVTGLALEALCAKRKEKPSGWVEKKALEGMLMKACLEISRGGKK